MSKFAIKVKEVCYNGKIYKAETLPSNMRQIEIPQIKGKGDADEWVKGRLANNDYWAKDDMLEYTLINGMPAGTLTQFILFNPHNLNNDAWVENENEKLGAKFIETLPFSSKDTYIEFYGTNKPRLEFYGANYEAVTMKEDPEFHPGVPQDISYRNFIRTRITYETEGRRTSSSALSFHWPISGYVYGDTVKNAFHGCWCGDFILALGPHYNGIVNNVATFRGVLDDIKAGTLNTTDYYKQFELGMFPLCGIARPGSTVNEILANTKKAVVSQKFKEPYAGLSYPDEKNLLIRDSFLSQEGIYDYFYDSNPIYNRGWHSSNGVDWYQSNVLGSGFYKQYASDLLLWTEGMQDAIIESDDSGGSGPISGPGGGGGSFDDTSDNIDDPALPAVSALSTGFISTYAPSISDINALSTKLWTKDFYDTIVKLWNSPMEAIISLQITFAPFNKGATKNMKIGNYDTAIPAPQVNNQFVKLDCGTIDMKEYWGNFLDYAPNTSLAIYLPFVGTRELDINNFMSGKIKVVYNIDVLSGTCTANISTIKDGINSVLYSFSGNCNIQIPTSSSDSSSLYQTAIKSISGTFQSVGQGMMHGGPYGAISGGVGGVIEQASNFIFSPQTHVATNGSVSGSGGALSVKVPYLILNRPIQSLAKGYNRDNGYPSNISSKLSSLNGYTKVLNIHLEGVSATQQEKEELESLLKAGVIL